MFEQNQNQSSTNNAVSEIDRKYPGLIQDPEIRSTFKKAWKEAAKRRILTAASCASYHILLGGKLDKAFSPLSNEGRIMSRASRDPYEAKGRALKAIAQGKREAFEPWAELFPESFSKAQYAWSNVLSGMSENSELLKASMLVKTFL